MGLYKVPSFVTGFARNSSQSLFPGLWKNLVSLWASSLGVQGNRLFDFANSGFRNDGTLTNMTNNNWVPGRDGWALSFVAASSQYIDVPDDDSLSFGDGSSDSPFSIVAPINMNDASNFRIISKGASSNNREWFFGTNLSDKLQATLYDRRNIQFLDLQSDSAITTDEGSWIQPAMTYDGSSTVAGLKLYRNGVLVPSSGSALNYTAMHNEANNAQIGRFMNFSEFADGKIGGVTLWRRVLLPQELALLAAIPNAPLILKDDLMAFLVAGRLSRYHDLSGLGSQGQMTWNPLG